MGKWISVKNEVPPIGLPVLIWNGTFNECEIRSRTDEFYPECEDEKNKYAWTEQGIVNDIEFWMPLPQPPEVKNE
jgi:hypothetical protein